MSNLRNIVFGLVMLLYLAFPLSMIGDYNKVKAEGHAYRMRPIPVDPFDAFRGAYLTLNYSNRISFENADSVFTVGQMIYVRLEKDTTGYASFASPSPQLPDNNAYVQTRIKRLYPNHLSIEIPDNISRYFLPAKQAKLAEDVYRDRVRDRTDKSTVHIDVKVLDGEIVIDELFLDDLPILQFLNNQLIAR